MIHSGLLMHIERRIHNKGMPAGECKYTPASCSKPASFVTQKTSLLFYHRPDAGALLFLLSA